MAVPSPPSRPATSSSSTSRSAGSTSRCRRPSSSAASRPPSVPSHATRAECWRSTRGSCPAPPMEPSPADPPAGVSPRFWALLCAEPLDGRDVLDVGTGTGRLALALAPFCRRVVGIDRDAVALEEARRRAKERRLDNVEFLALDAEGSDDYAEIASDRENPDLIVAHLCVSDRIIANSSRSLQSGQALAFVAFHADQWRETRRPPRFAPHAD